MEPLNPNVTAGQLSQDVSSLQGFSGIVKSPVVSSPFYGGGVNPARASGLDAFFGKVGSVFKEGGHLIESAGVWAARNLYDTAKNAINLPASSLHLGQDTFNQIHYGMQADGLNARLNDITSRYKSGLINSKEFQSEIAAWQKDNQSLSNNLDGLITKSKSDSNAFLHDTVATEAILLTVATGGLTGLAAKTADSGAASFGELLATRDLVDSGVQSISKLANDARLFKLLPQGIQNGLKASVTDTFLNATGEMTASQIAKSTAINLAIKYPIAFNYLTGTSDQIIKEMDSGKYGSAVKTLGFNMALLFSGGPIGQALKYGGKSLSAFSGKMFGSTSFIDELSKAAGYGPADIFNALKGSDPEVIKAFQALEATNMAATDGMAIDAAYRITDGLKQNAPDIFGSSPKEFVQDVHNWYLSQKDLTDTMSKQVGANEARKYVVGRWSPKTANYWAAELTKPGVAGEGFSSQAALDNWNKAIATNPNASFANNKNLYKQIENIMGTSQSWEEIHARISAIPASLEQDIPKSLAKRLADRGYIAITPSKLEAPFVEGTQPLKSAFAVGKNVGGDFFTKAVQPAPVLGEVGALLSHIGLSPVRAEESVSRLFNQALVKNLEKTSIESDPVLMRSKLTNTMNEINASRFQLNHPPMNDMRMLTVDEISKSLGVTKSQAKEVAGALMDSMLEVPASVKGAGNKLVDNLMKVNAGGKISMGGYLRVQGAVRFAWNPFFQMKASYKYESLAQLETGGKFPTVLGTNKIMAIVFPGRYREIENTANILEKNGMLGSGFTAEAASETTAGYGLTAAQLNKSQKLTIGSYVMSMADKMGMNSEQFIQNFPNEVKDATEAILHYNPKSNFLNSPLARTLNFVFFPFRFDFKVATFMARTLQRQNALIQTAVVAGMFHAHDFLTSTEGQVWYSQNSDVIGLLEYFTPVAELKLVAALGNIRNESVGSFGELGGLPVGFVTQILAAEGMWNPSTPYVDPKTGQPSSEYIPASDKAKLATALTSFMGSLFTYPGATAGLPGKTKFLSTLTRGLTGAKATDWNKVPETNLTPQQQQFQQAIQALNPQPNPLTPGVPTNAITTKATETGTASPIYTAAEKRSKGRVKKADEPVYALPGQSVPGQIP